MNNNESLKLLRKRALLAKQLMAKHLKSDWSFEYDRAVRRAGACKYPKKIISVSRHYAVTVTDEEFTQILLHEIAHAIIGPGFGHGPVWRRMSKQIGYTGSRLINIDLPVEPPWEGICPAGHKFKRFKRPRQAHSCSACYPGFSPLHQIQWTRTDA